MDNLRDMSIKDNKRLKHKPRSMYFDSSTVRSQHKEATKLHKKAANRIVFHQCIFEKIPHMYPNKKICLLNFANQNYPGVTFPNTSQTQEEELLRKFPGLFKLLSESGYYPIDSDSGGVIVTDYTEQYRGDDYEILHKDKVVRCMFVTAAAPDHRDYDFDEHKVLQHIRNIVLSPILFSDDDTRPDTLVIGAWGCGVYCPTHTFYESKIKPHVSGDFKCENYVQLIATCFKKILVDEKMYEYYGKVIIAIPDKPNLDKFVKVYAKIK